MIPPPVSILVATYGRVHLLEEVIQCFLSQDYPGHAELVILNDAKEQELVWDGIPPAGRSVRIINERVKRKLGDKRNQLVSLASHEIIQFWDDDDIYLNHKISAGYFLLAQEKEGTISFRKATAENREWRWLPAGLEYRYARPFGTATTTRSAIREAGWFPSVSQLADVQMCAAMGRKGMFTNVPVMNMPPATIYRRNAGAGVAHVTDSKQSDGSRLNDMAIEDLIQSNLAARIAAGQEPSGRVELVPHHDADYEALAENAWEKQKNT